MSANIVDVVEGNFEQEITQSDLPVLIDFWAPWCAPCRALSPTIEKIANDYSGKLKVVKINIDEAQELARKFGVRSIPQVYLTRGGDVVAQAAAPTRTRIFALLENLG